jgi:glycosyltransferase involved in cell wall biosynthesis
LKLTVIIPVYNEARTIGEVIRRVRSAAIAGVETEIVVVDDASSDATLAILEGIEGLTIRRHPVNRGKGASIRTGLSAATGDAVIIQDADLEYDPCDYEAILRPILNGGAEAVYGSRILGRNPHSYLRYYYGGRLLTVLFNLLYATRLTDLTTCYKAFRRETIASLDLRCARFEFCPEVTARLALRRIPILEVPISYRPRSIGEGKKIRWHDGLQAIWTMLALRMRPGG